MSGSNNTTLQSLRDLPDEAVLSDQQTSLLLNVSQDTLQRLDKAGEGPSPVVKLSPRRKGRTVGTIRRWLQEARVPDAFSPNNKNPRPLDGSSGEIAQPNSPFFSS